MNCKIWGSRTSIAKDADLLGSEMVVPVCALKDHSEFNDRVKLSKKKGLLDP